MLGVNVQSEGDVISQVLRQVEQQVQAGLEAQGQAVVAEMVKSMPQHGVQRTDPDYKTAPAGEPPYRHTGTFAESLDYAVEFGRVLAGPRASQVGTRGAIFEFGGRELLPGQRGKPRQRTYKRHPFIGPAFDAQLDRFAPRVAGAMTG